MIKRWLACAVCLCFWACATTQQPVEQPPAAKLVADMLSVDPAVKTGQLANGLRYVIRENGKPEHRAELRLVVNAGSILEEADQQGLAHFAEHMAFNGTEKFPKTAIVDFLEGIGMRFGPDLNAYTSFDETVYMLQVPTDSGQVLAKGFQILKEWAHNVRFEGEEIDKERGVVIEEWRLGRGAGARMRDKQFPILLKGSKYAERLPIGQKAVLDTFRHETLRRFYRTWYRPDLMSIIAVGDFQADSIAALIQKTFSEIPKVPNPMPRTVYPVPDHGETLFAIATDPEATRSSVGVYFKQPVVPEGSVDAYRQSLVKGLFNGMFNQRLHELTKKPDAPFLSGYSQQGRFVRSKAFYVLGAGVQEGGIKRGLEALLVEARRVEQFGFTLSELERQKADMMRNIEQAYRERDKSQSRGFASEYVRHVLVGEPIPGIEKERDLYQAFLPSISLDEINQLTREWITSGNRVVMVDAPEKDGLEAPTPDGLTAAMQRAQQAVVTPYTEEVSDAPLVAEPPAPAPIVLEKKIESIGVTEWTLGNGVRVILKPTDFKNDQVLFTAFSPGGSSLVEDRDYMSAEMATTVVQQSGLGDFSDVELDKKLAGKVARVSAGIGDLQESVSGSASPQDIETMFQLIYLTFTAPRADSVAYLAFKQQMQGWLQNRSASPEAAFADTVQVTMSQYHHRARPISLSLLDEMDMNKSLAIYRDRFADASDFTCVFVGNFNSEEMKPLVQTYLGGLPALNRNDMWRDVGVRPPKGVVEKTVYRGQEPKARVQVMFTGPFVLSATNRYTLGAMTDVLEIKLREILREDKGATYGVGVRADRSLYPVSEYTVLVSFGCAPERVDEMTRIVFAQIDSLKNHPVNDSYVAKVKEMDLKQREVQIKENEFWQNILEFYYRYGEDATQVLTFADGVIKPLTAEAVQKAAQTYFNMENYARFVLLPEKNN